MLKRVKDKSLVTVLTYKGLANGTCFTINGGPSRGHVISGRKKVKEGKAVRVCTIRIILKSLLAKEVVMFRIDVCLIEDDVMPKEVRHIGDFRENGSKGRKET